jgi:hypothetical protein
METLQDFMAKHDEITDIVNRVGASGTNGVNTLTSRVGYVKNSIEKNDYTYTNFHSLFDEFNRSRCSAEEIKDAEEVFQSLMNDLPKIKEKLSFNFTEQFTKIFEKNDFVEQWNSLTDEQKSDILYIDKNMYKILRTKIDVKEFDFLFKVEGQGKFDGEYPLDIYEWINALANSKVIFYKLRKAAQDDIHEEFFNSKEVIDAESANSGLRHQIAVKYLINRKNHDASDASWYDRLDMLTNSNASFHYTYHFFQDLENEFNGYNKIKENTKLPDILKKWSSELVGEQSEQYKKEREIFGKELEDKSMEERSKIYNASYHKYPTLEIAKSLQRGLKKDEFVALVKEAKGTEFEDFFNNPMTEKMRNEMPYKIIEYMFFYFCEKFNSQTKTKPKFN